MLNYQPGKHQDFNFALHSHVHVNNKEKETNGYSKMERVGLTVDTVLLVISIWTDRR